MILKAGQPIILRKYFANSYLNNTFSHLQGKLVFLKEDVDILNIYQFIFIKETFKAIRFEMMDLNKTIEVIQKIR